MNSKEKQKEIMDKFGRGEYPSYELEADLEELAEISYEEGRRDYKASPERLGFI